MKLRKRKVKINKQRRYILKGMRKLLVRPKVTFEIIDLSAGLPNALPFEFDWPSALTEKGKELLSAMESTPQLCAEVDPKDNIPLSTS